jgi:hypothetical protein
MTTALQKNHEQHFVAMAAIRLGKSWSLGPECEHPDFIITEDDHKFGLEVVEIFTDGKGIRGSANKRIESDTQRRIESDTQRMINSVRLEYEAIENAPLTVKFVGDIGVDNMVKVVPRLAALEIRSKPMSHHVIVDIQEELRARLRLHVTKGFRPDWINVMDRVGWVGRNPIPQIKAVIEKKSQKLLRYRETAGFDIRLLIVANRIHNSGKLTLDGQASLDKKGFQEIYFFSYPETVLLL